MYPQPRQPAWNSRILVEILLRAENHLPVGPTGFTSSSCLKRGSDDSFIPVPSCSSSFGRPPGSLDAWFALVCCHLSFLFFARNKDTIICSKQILYCTWGEGSFSPSFGVVYPPVYMGIVFSQRSCAASLTRECAHRGLGHTGLGQRGLGHRGLGHTGLGHRGFGHTVRGQRLRPFKQCGAYRL